MALLALLPMVYIVLDAFSTGGDRAVQLIFRERVRFLLGNTARLAFAGTLASLVLGTALAWLVERTDLPLRRTWTALLTVPLAVPAFVTSFGWVSLTPRVQTFWGAVLVVTLAYYPLVFLPAAATLRGLDPALEETAQALGLSRTRTFVRVVLPQLRPALLGGGLLVSLHLLSEYGALQLLRFETFTTAIYGEYESSFSGPAASTLAMVLVLLCLALLLAELRLRGQRRYSRVGAGSARTTEVQHLGAATVPASLAVLAVAALALAVPFGSLIRWLVRGTDTAFPVDRLVSTTLTSFGLGLGGAALTTVLAVPVALLAVRHRGPLSSALERTAYIANALPGIVVGLALVSVALEFVGPLYQSTALLLIAYAVLYLPRAIVTLRAAIAQAPVVLEDVAHTLGAGSWTTMRRVTLPLIARGLGAGTALVFIGVVTELTATLLLAPTGTNTLATEFWTQTGQIAYAEAAPYAALMVLISVPATFLLTRDPHRAGAT
ncbi:MAG: binding-protein-dependent transport system inner rane component [Frankiales bacterium]|nr:binding-protein-dependent transport system inner rane component [Frankiales bacterium]